MSSPAAMKDLHDRDRFRECPRCGDPVDDLPWDYEMGDWVTCDRDECREWAARTPPNREAEA